MTTINALADADLAQIFKWLPPIDRLGVSEVCLRWCSVSQEPWREVTRLELDSSIPAESIGAILRKCPNLTALFCKDQQLILDDLKNITLASVKSVAYHNCSFISYEYSANKTTMPLFRSEHGQSMEELILHEYNFGVETGLSERCSQHLLPDSLKRLQLSGLNKVCDFWFSDAKQYFCALAKLRSLECWVFQTKYCFSLDALQSLCALRELMLPSDFNDYPVAEILVDCVMNLLKLEIVVLPKIPSPLEDSVVLLDLFVKHPSLRILVIPGNVESYEAELQVPIRKRFPHSFATDPLPLLHVFVSQSAAELFRFDGSPVNWLRVHPINALFPELLEREEIAEIFGDSWIAKQIKEGAKRGLNFWRYEDNLME